MKKLMTLLILIPLLTSTHLFAAGPFVEEDFTWDPFTSLYKRVIVAGVNKMVRTNPNCTMPDPASLTRHGGTPDDPEFVVTCNEPGHVTHAYFTKTDITGDPASNIPLEE